MGCDDIRDLLALYAGGELEDGGRAAADGHLAFCAACARELDAYREARAALAGLREEEAAPGLWKDVREDLFPRRVPGFLDVALRCAAVLLIGVSIGVAAQLYRRGSAPEAPVSRVFESASRDVHAVRDGARAFAPGARPFENYFYMPRVETVRASGEKGF